MRNRTRVLAATAITAGLVTGAAGVAMASTANVQPPAQVRQVTIKAKCVLKSDQAAKLGVPVPRSGKGKQVIRISVGKAGGQPVKVDQPVKVKASAALPNGPGLPPGHARQVYGTAGNPPCAQSAGLKGAVSKVSVRVSVPKGQAAIIAAVASELNVPPARVAVALAPVLASGRVEVSSRAFAAAAASLGVSPGQLAGALAQAKESLAGGH